MNKRFLFLIETEQDINESKKFIDLVKTNFEFECHGLFVKDLTKYEFFNSNVSGMSAATPTTLRMNDYFEIENNNFEKLQKKSLNIFDTFYFVSGETKDCVLEELKAYDLLVIIKKDEIDNTIVSILKDHYKPLVILTSGYGEYSFENIVMLNDGGYKVNKSLYSFFNIFGIRNIDVLRVNVEEKNRLTEKFGDICNIIDKFGDNDYQIIKKQLEKYNFAIMGDLKYSVLIEKLTGHTGIKLLESENIPIFIG